MGAPTGVGGVTLRSARRGSNSHAAGEIPLLAADVRPTARSSRRDGGLDVLGARAGDYRAGVRGNTPAGCRREASVSAQEGGRGCIGR